eukprot:PhM_4_TR4833/c0_g1_i1/m.71672
MLMIDNLCQKSKKNGRGKPFFQKQKKDVGFFFSSFFPKDTHVLFIPCFMSKKSSCVFSPAHFCSSLFGPSLVIIFYFLPGGTYFVPVPDERATNFFGPSAAGSSVTAGAGVGAGAAVSIGFCGTTEATVPDALSLPRATNFFGPAAASAAGVGSDEDDEAAAGAGGASSGLDGGATTVPDALSWPRATNFFGPVDTGSGSGAGSGAVFFGCGLATSFGLGFLRSSRLTHSIELTPTSFGLTSFLERATNFLGPAGSSGAAGASSFGASTGVSSVLDDHWCESTVVVPMSISVRFCSTRAIVPSSSAFRTRLPAPNEAVSPVSVSPPPIPPPRRVLVFSFFLSFLLKRLWRLFFLSIVKEGFCFVVGVWEKVLERGFFQ